MQPPEYKEICSFGNLLSASKKAIRGRWRYSREAAEFLVDQEKNVWKLRKELEAYAYNPGAYRTFVIHDPKKRTISSVGIRDRVVHHAIVQVLGPFWEKSFIEHSYACRTGKGTHKAISKAFQCTRQYSYFVHHDVKKFFDTIDHEILKKMVCKNISDHGIIWLLHKIIDHSVPGMPSGKSVPIGNLTSQYFGNIYLTALDHFVKDLLGVHGYLRYMDDTCIFHKDKEKLIEISHAVEDFTEKKLKLTLAKNFVHPVYTGVPFLGLRIFPGQIRLQGSRWKKFKEKFHRLQERFRTKEISEEKFSLSLAAMVDHLHQADSFRLRSSFFEKYEIF